VRISISNEDVKAVLRILSERSFVLACSAIGALISLRAAGRI
jgi:hypothetical protein